MTITHNRSAHFMFIRIFFWTILITIVACWGSYSFASESKNSEQKLRDPRLRRRQIYYERIRNLKAKKRQTAPKQQPQHSRYQLTLHPLNNIHYLSGLTYHKGGADTGTLWAVSDRANRIYHLSPDGKLLSSFQVSIPSGSPLLPKQGFNAKSLDLEGIAVDKKGLLYVVSEANRAVLKLTSQGKLLAIFQVEGQNMATNRGLEGITYSPDTGLLYIQEEGSQDFSAHQSLYSYTLEGKKRGEYTLTGVRRLSGISAGPGYLLTLGFNDVTWPQIFRFPLFKSFEISETAISGAFIDLQKEYGEQLNQYPGNLNLEGITQDEKGQIYLAPDADPQKVEQSLLLILTPIIK